MSTQTNTSNENSKNIDYSQQRTPFYLVESDYDKCTIPPNTVTEIKAIDSVTKLEVFTSISFIHSIAASNST